MPENLTDFYGPLPQIADDEICIVTFSTGRRLVTASVNTRGGVCEDCQDADFYEATPITAYEVRKLHP